MFPKWTASRAVVSHRHLTLKLRRRPIIPARPNPVAFAPDASVVIS